MHFEIINRNEDKIRPNPVELLVLKSLEENRIELDCIELLLSEASLRHYYLENML